MSKIMTTLVNNGLCGNQCGASLRSQAPHARRHGSSRTGAGRLHLAVV